MAPVSTSRSLTRRQLRGFGLGSALILALLGTWVMVSEAIFGLELAPGLPVVVAGALWMAAGAMAALAAVAPRQLRLTHRLLAVLAWPIGWAVSHVVLAVVFYGVFTPVGLLFRLIGRDVLGKRFDPQAESYWTPREATEDVERYFRQS